MKADLITKLLGEQEEALVELWLKVQVGDENVPSELVAAKERRERSLEFVEAMRRALADELHPFDAPAWDEVRLFLEQMSRTWSRLGVTPPDTTTFILSFKQALFDLLWKDDDATDRQLREEIRVATQVLDQVGLYVMRVSLEERDEIIARQREEVLELSTPVVEAWDGILVLPIIGVLDSARTQDVMETLLSEIVRCGTEIAILDITGVPAVDSVTAQHIIKTVAAARLMGTTCMISGIRPQIAQTMVTLGVDLGDVETRGSLRAALASAIEARGFKVTKG